MHVCLRFKKELIVNDILVERGRLQAEVGVHPTCTPNKCIRIMYLMKWIVLAFCKQQKHSSKSRMCD